MSSQDVRSGSVVTESFEGQQSGNGEAPTPSPPASTSAGGENGNGEPRAAENAESSSSGETQPLRRRPRLNPTVDPSQVKAVPSLVSPPPSPAPATSRTATPAAASSNKATPAEEASQPAAAENAPPPSEAAAEAVPVAPAAEEVSPAAPAETEPADAEAKPQAAAEAEDREQSAVAEAPAHSAPVEIPTDDEDLDADLEAEIAAAMSADEQSVTAVAVPTEAAEGSSATVAAPSDEPPEAGARLKAVVQSVHAEDVFFDLGIRAPGIVQLRQFGADKQPAVGDEVEVVVDRFDEEEGLVYVNLPRSARKVGGDWSAVSVGQTVECTVTKTNKGGLEVQVGTLRGFMPAGQVDLGFISNLEPFVGQKLQAQVTEVNPRRRNLVLSRRTLLEAERKDAEEFLWAKLEVGQNYDGTVKTIKDYGAFVDIGGVDGFLHIGEISWNRIKHPSEVLQEGQDVRVKVISLDPEKKRISLGMRQLTSNPWLDAAEKYAKGTTVQGTVTRTTNFGAFVQLEPGVEGLVHISELDHRRVKTVTEVLSVGKEAEFQVLEVDPNRKRVSLSMKALQERPEPEPGEAKGAGSRSEPAPPRKQRSDLKGGMGEQSAGGLFGDPRNYG